MTVREKFGRLVLLDQTGHDRLGLEYRAARLGPAGLDRLVTVLRFGSAVSSHAEATSRLVEEARRVAQLHNPGLVRVLGIGRLDHSFYMSTELVEGRTLAQIIDRSRQDGFPFTPDQALMVVSRAASALEYLHGRKSDSGHRHFHGLISPTQLVVSFDGEVKIKGLGLWPALLRAELLDPEDRLRLSPEQAAGGAGGPASDVHALALVLLEALTGALPGETVRRSDLAVTTMTDATGQPVPLPSSLRELLRRALEVDPAARPPMPELRRAVDTILFSGDFTPTTFDLAFFMHTLFRDEMEHEAAALEEARRADYKEFLPGDASGAFPAVAAGPPPPDTEPLETGPVRISPVSDTEAAGSAEAAPPAVAAASIAEAPALTEPAPTEPGVTGGAITRVPEPTVVPPPTEAEKGRPDGTDPRVSESAVPRRGPGRPGRDRSDASARMRLAPAAAPRSDRGRSLWLVAGLVAALVVGGGGGYLYFVKLRRPTAPSTPSLSPETMLALARVKQLEARVAELEQEKSRAEEGAADEARRDVMARAAAGGHTPDPAALEAAQEQARRRARAEQERKQEEERRLLAEARKTEEDRIASAASAPAASPASPASAASGPSAEPSGSAPTPSSSPIASPTPSPTPASTRPGGPTAAGGPGEGATTTAPPPAAAVAPPAVSNTAASPAPASPTPSPTVKRGDLVEAGDPELKPPVLLSQVRPRYPPVALQARIEGTVELRALVTETGEVGEVQLVRVSREGLGFEEAALKHAQSRRYRPATKAGVAVRVWISIVVNFRNPQG
jgi:TonB family protein